MGSRNRHFTDGKGPQDRKRPAHDRGRSYQYEPCTAGYPILGPSYGAFPTGANDTSGKWCLPGGDVSIHYIAAGGQSTFGPVIDGNTGLLEVGCDQASGEGVEYLFESSGNAPIGRHSYVLADAKAMFGRLNFQIPTALNGFTEFAFGFRANEDFQTAIDNYEDFAVVNVQGVNVMVETNVGAAGTVSVDTGIDIGDGEDHEILAIVGDVGTHGVRLFFDGAPLDAGGYAFTGVTCVKPFLFLIHGSAAPAAYLNYFEIGYLRDVERGI